MVLRYVLTIASSAFTLATVGVTFTSPQPGHTLAFATFLGASASSSSTCPLMQEMVAVLSYVPDATAAWYFPISARTFAALGSLRPSMTSSQY